MNISKSISNMNVTWRFRSFISKLNDYKVNGVLLCVWKIFDLKNFPKEIATHILCYRMGWIKISEPSKKYKK